MKKRTKIDWITVVRICLAITIMGLFSAEFYRQSIVEGSDLNAHIRFAREGRGYSILYDALRVVLTVFDSNWAVAVFEAGIVIATWFVTEHYIRSRFNLNAMHALLISFGLLFLCSPYIPIVYPYFYSRGLVTQPWHNITYFGMRLFAIPVFFCTLDIIDKYRKGISLREWIWIAIPLYVCTSIKPNFLLSYSITLLIVLIADFLTDCMKRHMSTEVLIKYILMGSVVFPALFVLFGQSKILYGTSPATGESSGIEIVFRSSSFFKYGLIATAIKLARDTSVPFLTCIYGKRSISKKTGFVVLMLLVTIGEIIVFRETGRRATHGNFYWGIYSCGYFVFAYMVSWLAGMAAQNGWEEKKKGEKLLLITNAALIIWHFGSGIIYFLKILQSNGFAF